MLSVVELEPAVHSNQDFPTVRVPVDFAYHEVFLVEQSVPEGCVGMVLLAAARFVTMREHSVALPDRFAFVRLRFD